MTETAINPYAEPSAPEFNRTQQFREYFRENIVPKYYRGYLHVLSTVIMLVGALIFCASQISDLQAHELVMIPITLLIGNIAVYCIHRFVLHRTYKHVTYPYLVHTKWHHRFFTDQAPGFEKMNDFFIVLFPFRVVGSFTFIHLPLMYFLGGLFLSHNMLFLFLAMNAFYFMLYEIVHFICHLPPKSALLKFKLFYFLSEHHRLHHLPQAMRDYNFNVVFPLSDVVMGTVYAPKVTKKLSLL